MITFNQLKYIVLIILLFTALDYVGHSILETSYQLDKVPASYFTNKILYGIPILLIAVWLWDKKIINFGKGKYFKTFILTAIVVLALQFRYYYQYSSNFNYAIIILHYIILAPLIYWFIEEKKI